MRKTILTGFALACAASAFAGQTAQTPASTPTGSANETMTLIGCVGGGTTAADPFMLSDVSLGSVGTATPGQMPTTGAPATGTTPATTPTTGAATGTTGTAAGTPPSATAAGIAAATPSSPATAGTTGTAGTSGTAGTTGTAGTVGTTAGTPTAGAAAMTPSSPAVATSGYRLSGFDVAGFRGQRVQIVGMLAPSSAASASSGATGATDATRTGAREFKVQSVTPISGTCPQR